jgi:hypothetical protein
MPHYAGLTASDVRERAEALERFGRWEAAHPPSYTPQQALEGVSSLYELLPAEARKRPVDPSGVRAMHAALAVLGTRRA